jgi:hypothetical protein
MSYLLEIFNKCKTDGHFNKFDTIEAFESYFKDDDSYKKLWDFLKLKQYQVEGYDEFIRRIKEPLVSVNKFSTYLEKIYNKCREDGHFNKFESLESFFDYFKDETTYKKLWDFLNSKGYQVVPFDEFLINITGERPQEEIKQRRTGLFDGLPMPAYGDIDIIEDTNRMFPDVLRIGKITFGAIELPLMIPLYEQRGFTYIINNDNHKETAAKAIELMAIRILCSTPAGKSKLYIIDPEKNGQSFSHLFGLDPRILESEVWDDTHEIEDGLQNLKNQIPKIQAEILTTKYKDLRDYNEKVKHSRAPFQFILIANFPANFSSTSLEHLKGIIKNGSKSGIYVIMSYDTNIKLSSNEHFNPNDFRNLTVEYDFYNNKITNIDGNEVLNEMFFISSIDTVLPNNIERIKEELNRTLDQVQQLKIDVIDKSDFWLKSASKGISIPIGLSVDNKLINLQFGDGKDVYHALVGGATGKGKTVLLHDIILNGAKLYSPDELQFILMDYKEGTEFKVYTDLPHLKVLTISGEVEFGLSVFEYLNEEITRRGELFKNGGASDFTAYKLSAKEPLPRLMVIMDEFQVLLDPKKRVSSTVSAMLEDITRRGRSFGINLILSTQSLGEVDISSSTLGQLGTRVAFSMPEYDCLKILHIDNALPSEFTKAGQAVYNTNQGKKEGNITFQAAFIEKATIPKEVNEICTQSKFTRKGAFVFDGTRDARIEDNKSLTEKINSKALSKNDLYADAFIGEPFYLSNEHNFIRIRKQQESNILIIGDDPGGAISIAWNTLHQIMLQSHPNSKVILFDLFPVDSGWIGKFNNIEAEIVQNVTFYSKAKLLEKILVEIREELEQRFEEEGRPERIILCIMNANSVRDIRKSGYDLSPIATNLESIIKDGPEYGIHTILHFLNRKSFDEVFERNTYDEFENKILLKGQNPSDYGASTDETTSKEYMGFAIHPKAKYEADKFKIYKQ